MVIALTHPGPADAARFPVIAILACAMGIQNALMRRWGIRDLATNLYTLTYTGLFADSTLGGGDNPRALRRSVSVAIFLVSAIAAAFMTRYGILWPVLTDFLLFALSLLILLQPRSEVADAQKKSLGSSENWHRPGTASMYRLHNGSVTTRESGTSCLSCAPG